SGWDYLLLLAIVIFFKGWNMIANWWMLKIYDKNIRRINQGLRCILTIAIFYLIVKENMLIAGLITILFIGIFLYGLHISRHQPGLAWEVLVEKDQNSMQSFYRIANMFTDVPHFK